MNSKMCNLRVLLNPKLIENANFVDLEKYQKEYSTQSFPATACISLSTLVMLLDLEYLALQKLKMHEVYTYIVYIILYDIHTLYIYIYIYRLITSVI